MKKSMRLADIGSIDCLLRFSGRLLQVMLFLLLCIAVNAQSVVFYLDQVQYDQKPLLMNGVIGDWTNFQYVSFENRSGYYVNVRAHLHSEIDFIYFVNSENLAEDHLNVDIPPGRSYSLKVVARLNRGSAIVYNDQLGFDVTYQDNRTTYFELNASAYFYGANGNTSSGFSKPNNYGYIGNGYQEVEHGKPMRWSRTDFPLTVYSNHTSYGFDKEYTKVIQRAINMWNVAGRSTGIDKDIFRLTNDHNRADIRMDWSGQVLNNINKSNVLGVAIPLNNIIGMWPLQTYREYFHMSIGDVGETLVQELGHLLGPVHSEVANDIMNGSAHGHNHDLSQIQLSDRDRQMLGWIYSQKDFYRFAK